MEDIRFSKGTINRFDDNIILIEYDKNNSIETKDLEIEENLIQNLIGNEAYYAVSIIPMNFKNFSDESRLYILEENKKLKNRQVDCYVVGSITQRIELELYFQLHKPNRKTKVSGSINKALTWVQTQKNLNGIKEELIY